MRLTKVLLLLSAVVTFTYANGLELSEPEDGANGNSFDAGFGESSEPDIDHNVAPVESPNSVSAPAAVSEPVTDSIPNPVTDSLPPKSPPVDTSSIPAGLPPKNLPSENQAPTTKAPPSVQAPVESGDSIPSPDAAAVSGGSAEAGEKSENDEAGVAAGDTAASGSSNDNGEASDDYGDTKPIDNLDGVSPADTLDGNEESDAENKAAGDVNAAEANANANGESGNSGNDEGLASPGTVAAGLCGAAALSSAGIFLWVKKSKRQGYVQSVRTQISMV